MRLIYMLSAMAVVGLLLTLIAVVSSKNDGKHVEVQYTKKTTSTWDFDSTTCRMSQASNDRQFHVTCVESGPYSPR